MAVEKHCPACKDQTGGRKTPHTLRDGKWRCGLCGHETPKRSYTSKKSKDMEDLIKKLSEDAPANAGGGGNIAGAGVGSQGEPGVRPKVMKRYKDKNATEAPDPVMAPQPLRRSFKQFIKGK